MTSSSIPKPGDPFAVNTGTQVGGEAVEIDVLKAPGIEGDHIRYGDIFVRFQIVTPAIAQQWLATYNTRNRVQKDARIAMHARDMENGDWLITGDTIRFATVVGEDSTRTVVLIDGQHRLAAIVRSGVPQTSIIVTGLDIEAQEVVDTGVLRSLADTLTLEGWGGAAAKVAAITRRCASFESGLLLSIGSKRALSKTELHRWVNDPGRRPAIERAVQVFNRAVNAKAPVAGSIVASAYYLCAKKDQEAAEIFWLDMFIEQINIDNNHPAKALYRRLNRNEGQMHANEVFLTCIKAWNHWRKNEKVERILPPKSGWPKDMSEMPVF